MLGEVDVRGDLFEDTLSIDVLQSDITLQAAGEDAEFSEIECCKHLLDLFSIASTFDQEALGIVPAGVGVQKPDVLPTGQTTILAKPTAFAPIFTVLEVSVGGLHEGNERGAPCVLLALAVSQAANEGTSGTRSGDAPIGTV